MMKVVRMMVIIPHVMVEEPHKMAKALHILTEAPLEKTSHHLRQFWLSIITGTIILRIFSDSWCNQLHFGTSYNIVARTLSENSLSKRGCKNCRRNTHSSRTK